MQGLGDVVNGLLQILPTWALVLLGVIVAAVAIPGWHHNARVKRMRGLVRRMVRAEPDRLPALQEQVQVLCAGHADLLEALVKEARKRHQPELERWALGALEDLPGAAQRALRLKAEVSRERAPARHPLETAVVVETLMREGAWEAARVRLDEARAEHPHNPRLAELSEAVAARRAPEAEASGPAPTEGAGPRASSPSDGTALDAPQARR